MDIACNTVGNVTPPTRGTPNNNGNGAGAAPASSSNKNHQIPSDILDDLASRFIINVPDDERNNLIRICFQIELAHWFYLDFFCAMEERKLVNIGIKQFAVHLFQHIPFLRKHLSSLDKILEDWKNYKLSVPTYGAILISEDLNHVLLVQSYWAKSSWGFPKGKVNEHEDPVHCAAREVFEETGYDITGLIVPHEYIDSVINFQYTRLYLVRNVPLATEFLPRTRKEIKSCDWFPVDSLPINKNHAISKQQLGYNANSFFMIMPFMKRLKKWVNDNRSGIESKLRKVSTSSSSTSPVQFASSKDIESNMRMYKESIAVANGNGSGSGNGKRKRQRHKSMGDIDGVKLGLSNSTNNCKLSSGGTKSNNHAGAPSSAGVLPAGEGDTFFGSHKAKAPSQQQHSKRQLLFTNQPNGGGVSATDEVGRKSMSASKSKATATDKQQQSSAQSSKKQQQQSPQSNRVRTKSQTQPQPPHSNNKPRVQMQQAATAFSSLSLASSVAAASSASNTANQILKFNPNFDSWTNFSFTKNFIANVFC